MTSDDVISCVTNAPEAWKIFAAIAFMNGFSAALEKVANKTKNKPVKTVASGLHGLIVLVLNVTNFMIAKPTKPMRERAFTQDDKK